MRHLDQRRSRLIQQCIAVVGDDGFECTGFHEAHQEVNRSTSHAHVVDDTLRLEALQHVHRSSTRHGGFERGVLRIVHEDDLQMLQPEQAQAALHGSPELLPAEVAAAQITIGFGRQHGAVR